MITNPKKKNKRKTKINITMISRKISRVTIINNNMRNTSREIKNKINRNTPTIISITIIKRRNSILVATKIKISTAIRIGITLGILFTMKEIFEEVTKIWTSVAIMTIDESNLIKSK